MYFVEDEEIAKNLQRSLNNTKAYSPEKYERENLRLTDPRLEYHDPAPSIHELFVLFDKRFFWGKLGRVEVKWSSKMTKCAGLCYYEGKTGLCRIKLSAPLLSLRSRKDLVETLLHEMIHAYLFVTENDNDREQHGPNFRKHMYRINKEAGTDISIYHTFYNEVAYYERHIWRCNGVCQTRRPFFGFVKRTINRAPGPNDYWWAEHQNNCGGTFIKVSEPEKHCKKNVKQEKDKAIKAPPGTRDIRDFLQRESHKKLPETIVKEDMSNTQNVNNVRGLNNIHKNSENIFQSMRNPNQAHAIKSQIGDSRLSKNNVKLRDDKDKDEYSRVRATVRNAWANKYLSPSKTEPRPNSPTLRPPITIEMKRKEIECPVCCLPFSETVINEHIDECLLKDKSMENVNETVFTKEVKQGKSQTLNGESLNNKLVPCPVCRKVLPGQSLNDHLDVCLNVSFENEDNSHDDETDNDKVPCPCCFKWVLEKTINDHVNECLTHSHEDRTKYD